MPLVVVALVVAAPVSAQSDTVRLRRVSTWQKDVDQLRRELIDRQRREFELVRILNNLERQRSEASDSQLVSLRAQSQLVVTQLRSAVEEQSRLKSQLESMCAEVQKPAGWLGVSATGMQLIDREGNGPQIVRFLETPIVESVDPGSPADRVGLRAGDELMEIGGKRLLQSNIVFAELLKPGETIIVKVRRGNDVIAVRPRIEPAPQQIIAAPCMQVDAASYYVMAPSRAQGEVVATGGGNGFVYTTTTPARRDTIRAAAGAIRPVPETNVITAAPMARMFGSVGNSLAGLELMALNAESGRAFGVTHGLFVGQVAPGTPGREAGLQGGDVLISADSTDLRSIVTLQRVISRARDRVVSITVIRKGKQETVQLKW